MITEKNQIYKCELCGNVVEITSEGSGQLVCCEQPMKLLATNTVDGVEEKHIPVIKQLIYGGCVVTIGEVDHPMEKEHFIEWVEIINGSYVNRKYLQPGDEPRVEFYVNKSDNIEVRAYCNVHGLWKK